MMEEYTEYSDQEHGRQFSCARGSPIFVSNHIGPLTTAYDFKFSLLQELEDMKTELALNDDYEEDLSIDELKIFTEEELVEKALKYEFEHDSGHDNTWQIVEHTNFDNCQVVDLNKDIVCSSSINGTSTLESSTLLNDSVVLACGSNISEKVHQKKCRKRGRFFDRNTRAAELESSYFDKVQQLAKIKQRQDQDKLAAQLHSFCGNSKTMDGAIITLDKIEKMKSLSSVTSSVKVKAPSSKVQVPVCYPEVVLCVEIFHQQQKSKKVQEFLVLGRQYLTELRDHIYCLTDKLMQAAEKHDTSGYFLIEETFCNDMRSPSATDYSKPIFDWLENQRDEATKKWEFIMSGEPKKKHKELLGHLDISSLPDFKAVDMDKVRFCDLRFRLGAGYLYCHQGDCRHIMVFRDMRLIHAEDSHNQTDYPLLTYQFRHRHRKCSVCQIYQATKMTVDDKWAQENPCYFCLKCYYLLHYKEDNTVLYPHTVYDYYHE